MFSVLNAFAAGGLGAILWTCTGLPVALRLASRPLALAMAPALGWAIHSALALPVFSLLGMSRMVVATVMAASAIGGVIASRMPWQRKSSGDEPAVPPWTLAIAALIALVPAVAIVPQISVDGVTLADAIFDHSKIALIDEIARFGVPAGNPFYGEVGAPDRLSYYYLWHFSAAELAVALGASGWESDAALTWFTAAASLSLMMGLAVWLGSRGAAIWIPLLALTASLRPILAALFDQDLVRKATGFGGWLFQVTWAPQHVAAATCVILAGFLFARLAQAQSLLTLATLVLLVAAGFESSVWAGGVAFAVAAVAIVPALLWSMERKSRTPYLGSLAIAAILAAVLCAPFLYDQYLSAVARGDGSPIAFAPYQVLDGAIPEALRPLLDLPAYWLVFLVLEFPAFYAAGVVGLVSAVRDRTLDYDRRLAVLAFAALTFASLATTWLLASVINNNDDLGWRAVLPGAMLLMVFAATALARWLSSRRMMAFAAACIAVVLGLPEGLRLARENVADRSQPSEALFAAAPAMWQAVRRHAGDMDRVANNPLFLRDMTPWPVNISWALLANRRSCYAGRELALAFAALSRERRELVDAQFIRVFEGKPAPDDVRELAQRYRCAVVVVTPQDGAWTRDPFATSGLYQLVEAQPTWRIYKALRER